MVRVQSARLLSSAAVCLLLFPPVLQAAEHAAGLQVGYGRGFGLLLHSTVSEFAEGFPLELRYVGGNEEFDVTCRQWGVCGGVESHHRLLNNQNIDLVVAAMLDYYLEAPLHGHDTSYRPGGGDVNARRDYTWADADGAIRQPKLVPRIMVGINRKFGGGRAAAAEAGRR